MTTRAFDPAGFSNNPDFDTGSPAGVWTQRNEQSEIWTEALANRARVFSPLVFSLWPVFATGVSSDFWTEKTQQAETWAPK